MAKLVIDAYVGPGPYKATQEEWDADYASHMADALVRIAADLRSITISKPAVEVKVTIGRCEKREEGESEWWTPSEAEYECEVCHNLAQVLRVNRAECACWGMLVDCRTCGLRHVT